MQSTIAQFSIVQVRLFGTLIGEFFNTRDLFAPLPQEEERSGPLLGYSVVDRGGLNQTHRVVVLGRESVDSFGKLFSHLRVQSGSILHQDGLRLDLGHSELGSMVHVHVARCRATTWVVHLVARGGIGHGETGAWRQAGHNIYVLGGVVPLIEVMERYFVEVLQAVLIIGTKAIAPGGNPLGLLLQGQSCSYSAASDQRDDVSVSVSGHGKMSCIQGP